MKKVKVYFFKVFINVFLVMVALPCSSYNCIGILFIVSFQSGQLVRNLGDEPFNLQSILRKLDFTFTSD